MSKKHKKYYIQFNSESQKNMTEELMVNGITSYPNYVIDIIWINDLITKSLVKATDGYVRLIASRNSITVLNPDGKIHSFRLYSF